ncbi:MAG: carbamate kinase [Planctomycetes bacterium]|nr:carbamate kinase [Planctomycetota bacterium]
MTSGPDHRSRPAPVVVALGGNAISPQRRDDDDIPNQFKQTRRTATVLAELLASGAPVLITHGNGPQIGEAVRRGELASDEVYEIPLGVLVADLAGGMGYMIAQCVNNALRQMGSDRIVSTLVTNVVVDADDPHFQEPTKPIGSFYTAERARIMMSRGWKMVEIPNRGFRRVVPSPAPLEILEIELIRRLMAAGEGLIVAGGGGVPVVREPDGSLEGREAVIDKDLTAGLIARRVGAEVLFLVTNVTQVAIDFEKPTERRLERTTTDEVERWLDEGQFPPGSMGPKIEAAIEFLRASGPAARVIISDVEHMAEALDGRAGTTIRA